jgi:hypothetical protein
MTCAIFSRRCVHARSAGARRGNPGPVARCPWPPPPPPRPGPPPLAGGTHEGTPRQPPPSRAQVRRRLQGAGAAALCTRAALHPAGALHPGHARLLAGGHAAQPARAVAGRAHLLRRRHDGRLCSRPGQGLPGVRAPAARRPCRLRPLPPPPCMHACMVPPRPGHTWALRPQIPSRANRSAAAPPTPHPRLGSLGSPAAGCARWRSCSPSTPRRRSSSPMPA